MLGAIIGDIVGSVYEWNRIKTKEFPLFSDKSFFTDDTVMICAVASAFLKGSPMNASEFEETLIHEMRYFGNKYPGAGYGSRFSDDRILLQCEKCGAVVFYEFYEIVDYSGDDDKMYSTAHHVDSIEDSDNLNKLNPLELLGVSMERPSLRY